MELTEPLARLATALPVFATHLAIALATLLLAFAIVLRATPADELKLIREGNVAAAVWAGGTIIALALPIAAAMRYSGGTAEVVVWSAIAMALQLGTYLVTCLLVGKTRQKLESGDMASAIMVAATQIGVGIVNAAALSG